MAQIKSYNKKNGVTYVYDSVSYYDKEKHQSRSRRKLIGKIDPDTGEIVPTGKKKDETDYKSLYKKALKEIDRNNIRIDELENKLKDVYTELKQCKKDFSKISDISDKYTKDNNKN